jgi:hypothetical protein
MRTLSTCLLRYSAEAIGYRLVERGVRFDLRDDSERLYLTNASRKLIARFLLESAVARIDNEREARSVAFMVDSSHPTGGGVRQRVGPSDKHAE